MRLADLRPAMKVVGFGEDDRMPGTTEVFVVQILGLDRVRVRDGHGREGWLEPRMLDREIGEARYDAIMTTLHGPDWRLPFPKKPAADRDAAAPVP